MAFDPAALSPTAAISSPSSSRSTPRPIPARAISNQSPRTQHGIDKLDQRDLDPHDGAKKDGRRSRRNSDGSVTMGFPNAAGVSGKGQQLVEMFGVRSVVVPSPLASVIDMVCARRDNEAWEDFGTSRFKGDRGASANSKESIAPPVVKQDRISRTDSIWDIEVSSLLHRCRRESQIDDDMQATLKAGKPVGQAPPPPLPAFPSNYDFTASEKDSFSTDNKPKRSKSLVARFRGARKNPDNPMGSDEPAESSPSSRRMNAAQRSADSPAVIPETHSTIPSSAPQPIRTRAVNFDETGLATSPTEARGNGSRFNGGAILGASRSLGPEVKLDGAKYEEGALARGGGGSGGLGRRPSVMQRLFRGKAK